MAATCSVAECGRAAVAHGLCASHYKQKQRGKEPTPLRTGPALVRISLRVSATCRSRVLADAARARAALEAWAARVKPPA